MRYANILVSADSGEGMADRARLAASLARRFEATLTGGAAEAVPAPVLVHNIGDAIRQEEANEARIREALDGIHRRFAESVAAGVPVDWRSAFTGPAAHIVALARAADLVVVGRHGPDEATPRVGHVPAGPVLMEAGRPVLVVPPGLAEVRGARIVVAWKDGPAARRAVAAALPFLRAADHVHVATTGEEARLEGGEDVAGHLARHGASVTTHFLRPLDTAASEILRFARAQDADLLVMGAYGHSRLREWVFGGVTREILQRSPLCCLMSH